MTNEAREQIARTLMSVKIDGRSIAWERAIACANALYEAGYRPRPKLTLIKDEEIFHAYNVGWLPYKAEALTEDDLRRLRGRAIAQAQLDHDREG